MGKEQPNYYAIIPAKIRYDRNLKANEKLLYGEITALANKNGYCWAENQYFASLYGVHKITVSNWINALEEKGYITTELEYIPKTKQVKRRYIRILDSNTPLNEKTKGSKRKDLGGLNENTNTPLNEKTKEELNNTSINNTSINKDRPAKAEPHIPYKDIVDHLNKKADKHFKHSTSKTKSLIKARWNEGFRADDFKKVIDVKVSEWNNDSTMQKYVRPETLFGTKFEGYLNEKETVSTQEELGYDTSEYDEFF